MKKRRTPQEKKQLSYANDRRNAYGESDKASRKAIPKRKRIVNQTFRQAIHRLLKAIDLTKRAADPDQVTDVEGQINSQQRIDWRKSPDMPLDRFIQWQRVKHKARVVRNREKGNLNV